ncbi:MAG TPA: metal ABC transporter permease [Oligoflexus sp.]|uniref:metal ABC transporter permease n=1 Tax=Oligoflexus sp. TaxID=1971216 RepID=UPI002D34B9F5|nr:metal ABC transporter permease [Oligoflexus sp.]HYX36991.1 metal ABC transporter permease [Oligoflexus sp.]
MNQLLSIYGWTIAASMFLAAGLALLGSQLAARDRAMQTLCLGQGAMLGVLLGLGLAVHPLFPLLTALISAALTFGISEFLVARRMASSNTHFASLFAVLLAGGYLISALFPALENHMAQKYFGDLATLSTEESYWGLIVGVVLLMLMIVYHRRFTCESFEKAITGSQRVGRWPWTSFDLIALLTLCFCVQTVGYLFTIACLFLPTAVASRQLPAGLRRHLWFCGTTSAVAAGAGFLLSLESSRLPTVPSIIVMILITSLMMTPFFSRKMPHR